MKTLTFKEEIVDIVNSTVVEIVIDKDGKTVWVNVDGVPISRSKG